MKMGSSFNRAIFDDNIQAGLVGWAQKAKNKGKKGSVSSSVSNHQESPLLRMEMMGIQVQTPPSLHNGTNPEIKHDTS